MTKPLLALDFDGTYTHDSSKFRAIIRCFQSQGYDVKIVTMRCKIKDWDDEFKFLKDHYDVDTIFCDGQPKRQVCAELGVFPTWWLDDYPEGISQGSQYSPKELQEWRNEQKALKEDKTLKVA